MSDIYQVGRNIFAITPSGIIAIPSGSNTVAGTAISASIPQILAITCSSNFNNRLTKLTTLNAFGTITLSSGSSNFNDTRIILRYIDSSSRGIIEAIDDAGLGNDGESITKNLSFTDTKLNDTVVDIPINNNDDSFLVAYRTIEALNNSPAFNSSFKAEIVDDGSSLSALTASIGNMTIGSGFKIRNSASLGTNSLTDGGEGKFTITSINSGSVALPDFSGTQVQVGGMMIGSSFKVGGSPDTFSFNIIQSGSGKTNQRFYPGRVSSVSASLVQRIDPDDNKSFEFLVPSQSVGGDDDLAALYISSSRRIGFATKDPLTDIDIRADEFQIKRTLEDKGLRVNNEGNIESFDKTPESAATGSEFILNYSRGVAITAAFVNAIFGQSFSNDTDAQNFFNNLKPDDQSGGIKKGELAGFITPPAIGDTLGAIRWIAQSGSVGDFDERRAGEAAIIKAVVSDGASDGIEADLIFSVADRTGGSAQKFLLDANNQHQLTGSLNISALLTTSTLTAGLTTFTGDIKLGDNKKIKNTNENGTFIQVINDDYWKFSANNQHLADFQSTLINFNPGGASGLNFQVEGDTNQYLIFTDSSEDKVAIGTNTVSDSLLTINGDVSASGDLSIQGFSSVSASLAAAGSGGGSADNLGNHTATQDLNMGGFNIDNAQHITGSNISASGEITAVRYAGDGGTSTFASIANVNTTHVTASGNISASGTITAAEGVFGTGTTTINDSINTTGNITASGDISASGTGSFAMVGIGTSTPEENLHVIGNVRIASSDPNLRIEDTNGRSVEIDVTDDTFRIDDVGNNAAIFTTDLSTNPTQTTFQTKPTFLRDVQFDSNINTSGHITASGNISASGNIIGGTITSNGNAVISQSGAFTNNEFIVAVGDSAVTSSDALAVDSDGNLGIGTPNPEVRLHMLGEDAQTTQILMEQFNNSADAPDIRTRRYRGTSASRADVQTGDYLFRLNVHGQDGGSSELYGSMRFDVDSSDQDALEWGLQTRDTAGTVADRLIIDANGNFTASGEISSTINGGSF